VNSASADETQQAIIIAAAFKATLPGAFPDLQ
jgi:hypothetical protein